MNKATWLLAVAVLALCISPVRAYGLVVEDVDGMRAPLMERFGGHPGIVHLWATWCAPCLDERPALAAFLARRPDLAAHVAVVSVDTKPTARVAEFLIDRLGLEDLPTLRVVEGSADEPFGVQVYPSTVFVAADGTVARTVAGEVEWSSAAAEGTVEAHVFPGQ